jgi:tetratricopeptide (TPR) repeat protein
LSRISHAAALLANVCFDQGDFVLAERYMTEGLQTGRAVQEKWHCALIVTNMADHTALLGNFAEAQRLFAEALTNLRQIGEKWALGLALYHLGKMVYYQGDYARAQEISLESRAVSQTVTTSSSFYAGPCRILGLLAVEQNDFAQARQWLVESLIIVDELGNRRNIAHTFDAFAQLALKQNQSERTLRLAGAAWSLRAGMGFILPPVEQRRFDQMCTTARQMLHAIAASTSWSDGEKMTLDEAVAYALSMV